MRPAQTSALVAEQIVAGVITSIDASVLRLERFAAATGTSRVRLIEAVTPAAWV